MEPKRHERHVYGKKKMRGPKALKKKKELDIQITDTESDICDPVDFLLPSSSANNVNTEMDIEEQESDNPTTSHEIFVGDEAEVNHSECSYWDDETIFTMNTQECINKKDIPAKCNETPSLNYDYSNVSNYSIIKEEVVENLSKNLELEGNRLVNIDFFIKGLQRMNNHSFPGKCNFTDMVVEKEIRIGLNSKIIFVCKMCRVRSVIYTCKNSTEQLDDKSKDVNINEAAVLATQTIGCGFFNLEEFLSILNVPTMSTFFFQKYSTILRDRLEPTSSKIMSEAIEEEKILALENNDLDEYGLPKITVVTDGAWSKRSYRSNYSALSGVVTLIGYYTRKVLWVGVKNKYCALCERSKDPIRIQNHKCNKNYSGSSTGKA